MFNLKFYFMKKISFLLILTLMVGMFWGCDDDSKKKTSKPTSYIECSDDAAIATTFGLLNYFGTDSGKCVLGIDVYAGMTYEEYTNDSYTKNPVAILKLTVITDTATIVPSGTYTVTDTTGLNSIIAAQFLYAPNGITETVGSEDYLINYGKLKVTSSNGQYILDFDGNARQGMNIDMHYVGTLLYSDKSKNPNN